jgi:hypothetical protein
MHGHMNVKLVVIPYRFFGTTCRSHFQGSKMGPTGRPVTEAWNQA